MTSLAEILVANHVVTPPRDFFTENPTRVHEERVRTNESEDGTDCAIRRRSDSATQFESHSTPMQQEVRI